MNHQQFSRFFLWMALGFAVLVLLFLHTGLCCPVQVALSPKIAVLRSEQMMEAIVQGDLQTACTFIDGTPVFQAVDEHTNALNSILWDFYYENIEYSFETGCYGADGGLARDVSVTAPDLERLLAEVDTRYKALLEEKIGAAANSNPGQYQRMILEEVLNMVLAEEPSTASSTLTFHLVFRDGQWFHLLDGDLLKLLSGKNIS